MEISSLRRQPGGLLDAFVQNQIFGFAKTKTGFAFRTDINAIVLVNIMQVSQAERQKDIRVIWQVLTVPV